MKTLIQDILQKLDQDNRYIEIHIEESYPTIIQYNGKELETISDSSFFAGNIRILEKGYWAFYSFNQWDKDKIVQEIEKILKGFALLKPKTKPFFKQKPICDKIQTSYQKNPKNFSLEERNQIIKSYHNILQNPKITNSRSTYKDVWKKIIFANSEGSFIEQEKLFTGISLYAMAREGNTIEQSFFSHAGYGGLELIEGKEQEAEEIVKNTIELLSATPIEKGKYSVILDPRIAGVFAHEAFGHLSEADFIYENPSIQKMMELGRVFGKEELTIIDDGSLPGLAGYTPYDDEGIPAQRTYLIQNGKLKSRLHSRETASQMQEGVSGNARALNPLYAPLVRMTNTFIDKGKLSKEALFEKMQDGVYCVDYIGGMTNLEMFTFTPGRAFIVKNGKIKQLVKNAVLNGNVFETLLAIDGIADDLQHFGTLGGCGKGGQSGLPVTIGSPHILVHNVLIG